MTVYKTKSFDKTQNSDLTDEALIQVCRNLESGLIDADLGGLFTNSA